MGVYVAVHLSILICLILCGCVCVRGDDLGAEVRGHLAGFHSLLLTCGFLWIELRLAGKHPSQMSQLAGPMMLFSDSHYGPGHAWVLGVSDSWSARAGRQ